MGWTFCRSAKMKIGAENQIQQENSISKGLADAILHAAGK
jgi:hypothetical protein